MKYDNFDQLDIVTKGITVSEEGVYLLTHEIDIAVYHLYALGNHFVLVTYSKTRGKIHHISLWSYKNLDIFLEQINLDDLLKSKI